MLVRMLAVAMSAYVTATGTIRQVACMMGDGTAS